MMKLKVLAFGIAREIFGADRAELELPTGCTVGELKQKLNAQHPGLAALASYAIAINATYAFDDDVIQASDELAIIPPVSGG
jgi:molybdopterin synthase sulfur carrier subunit